MKEPICKMPTFDLIEDLTLRSKNRGAILANLFEDYYEHMGGPSGSYARFQNLYKDYLSFIPHNERENAVKEMHNHLTDRGYRYGS